MNVFSDSYVPQWLEDVNAAAGLVTRSVNIEPLELQRLKYIQSFSGTDVWQWYPRADVSTVDSTEIKRYLAQIADFVQQEWLAKLKKAKGWDRFNIKIEPFEVPWQASRTSEFGQNDATRLYQCTIHGLQEFTPAANLGDVSQSPHVWMQLMVRLSNYANWCPSYVHLMVMYTLR